MERECNTCGYRVNMDVAKSRGLTTKGIGDDVALDYCYCYSGPVRTSGCEHWMDYRERDCETNPPR